MVFGLSSPNLRRERFSALPKSRIVYRKIMHFQDEFKSSELSTNAILTPPKPDGFKIPAGQRGCFLFEVLVEVEISAFRR